MSLLDLTGKRASPTGIANADIVQNAIDLAHVLEIDSPRILTNEKMMIASHTLACIQA